MTEDCLSFGSEYPCQPEANPKPVSICREKYNYGFCSVIEYAQLRAGAHLPAPSVRLGREQHSEENLAPMVVPFVEKASLFVRKAPSTWVVNASKRRCFHW